MLIVKISSIVFVGGVTVILGGMTAAWRRASVVIAHTVATSRWMNGEVSLEPPTVRQLSQEDIIRYTPNWVSSRHLLALVFLFCTAVLAFVLFRWYVGLAVAVATYALMELAGFAFPNRNNLYYVIQVYDSYSKSIRIAERFANVARASDFRERLREIQDAYGKRLAVKTEDGQQAPGADSPKVAHQE